MRILRTALVLGAGYVLGARAGRERYEQIAATAQKLWESAPFKHGRETARDTAASTFEQAKQAAASKAKEAAEAVKSKVASAQNNLDEAVIEVDPIE